MNSTNLKCLWVCLCFAFFFCLFNEMRWLDGFLCVVKGFINLSLSFDFICAGSKYCRRWTGPSDGNTDVSVCVSLNFGNVLLKHKAALVYAHSTLSAEPLLFYLNKKKSFFLFWPFFLSTKLSPLLSSLSSASLFCGSDSRDALPFHSLSHLKPSLLPLIHFSSCSAPPKPPGPQLSGQGERKKKRKKAMQMRDGGLKAAGGAALAAERAAAGKMEKVQGAFLKALRIRLLFRLFVLVNLRTHWLRRLVNATPGSFVSGSDWLIIKVGCTAGTTQAWKNAAVNRIVRKQSHISGQWASVMEEARQTFVKHYSVQQVSNCKVYTWVLSPWSLLFRLLLLLLFLHFSISPGIFAMSWAERKNFLDSCTFNYHHHNGWR